MAADLKVSGRMTVKTLKAHFKDEFGGTLRVYDGRSKADDNATLASIRRNDDAKGGEIVCNGHLTVGNFERRMLQTFGIKVQVATPDDWTLVLDGITLAKLKSIPEKCSKADMESLVGYKRKAKRAEDVDADSAEVDDDLTDVDNNEDNGEFLPAEEIKRLESLEYTFTPECAIETARFDPENPFYWCHVQAAWAVVNDMLNGEPVETSRGYLAERANYRDGAYIHFEDSDPDFIVVVVDGKIIGVITSEDADRAYEEC